VLSVEALAHQAGRQARARLTEVFPGPAELCASGPEGRFAHQLIVPLIRQQPAAGPERADAAGTGRAPAAVPAPRPPQVPADPAHSAPAHAAGAAVRPQAMPAVQRFLPGSDWLYLKLFAGAATSDMVLRRAAPVLAGALASSAADQWFFI